MSKEKNNDSYQPKEVRGYQPQDNQQQTVTPPKGGTGEVNNQNLNTSQNDT